MFCKYKELKVHKELHLEVAKSTSPNFSCFPDILLLGAEASPRARCISESLGAIMNSLWAPWILENIWNFASRLVAAFICSIFITKLWTLDCCLAIMICIKYRNIFRNHWKVADTLLVLTDISFSPPSCNYPSTSPEMIGSCYHQTPCDHIYLSFWPRLPFPPSSITSSLHCIIVGWGW